MLSKIKNIIKIIFIISIFIYADTSFALNGNANTIKNSIIPTGGNSINIVNKGDLTINSSNSLLDNLLKFVKNSIFSLISIIAIGVFIYIGAKLIIARGNPEEFKKGIMSFIYAVAGIFIVAISWGIVKLVTGININ